MKVEINSTDMVGKKKEVTDTQHTHRRINHQQKML